MTKGRFIEDLVHGIPIYPFSSTPDGRIVGELHRGRIEARDFQRESLAVQANALREIAKLHGNQTQISPSEFRGEQTRDVLMGMTGQLYDLHSAQKDTVRQLEGLNQTTAQGFGVLHGDMGALKGPDNGTSSLADLIRKDFGLSEALSAYFKGVLNKQGEGEIFWLLYHKVSIQKETEDGIRKKIEEGLADRGRSLNEFPEIKDALRLLDHYDVRYDLVGTQKKTKILAFLASEFQIADLRVFVRQMEELFTLFEQAKAQPIREETLLSLAKNNYLTEPMRNRVMELYPEARKDASLTTINYSLLDLLRANVDATRQRTFQIAEGLAVIDQNEEALAQNRQMLEQGESANEKSDMMIKQGDHAIRQRQVITAQGAYGLAQNARAIEQRQVITAQGTVAIAQGARAIGQRARAIGQRNLTNYRLGSILDTMIDVNDSIIDLTAVVEGFSDMVNDGLSQIDQTLSNGFQAVDQTLSNGFQRVDQTLSNGFQAVDQTLSNGFQTVDSGLKNIVTEMVITRAAVIADLERIERGIGTAAQQVTEAINRGNIALETLVHLNKTSHNVEAGQYFDDAKECLFTAKTRNDVKDAYEGFCKSAEIVKSSAEYQYGAGYTSELLGMLDEASSRYEKVTTRAKDEQKDLASNAFVGIARIQHRQGDTENALENTGKAIESNKNNETAQFDQCKYLLLLGFVDEALKNLEEMIKAKPLYFAKMRAEPAFKLIPVEKLREFWKVLLDADAIKSPKSLVLLLEDMIETESLDLANTVFFRLLETNPKALLDRKIWLHPGFNNLLNNEIIAEITVFIETKMNLLVEEDCYIICSLLNYCGTTEVSLLKAFKIGLEQDPLFYSDYQPEAKRKLKAKLIKCMGNQTESILRKLKKECGTDTKFDWVF
ncbi:MAG: hypothetical protein WC843_04340 [Candidatus Gracilibacteria bacterium]|jgi:tetratricopeptide (TPR) repeat protein